MPNPIVPITISTQLRDVSGPKVHIVLGVGVAGLFAFGLQGSDATVSGTSRAYVRDGIEPGISARNNLTVMKLCDAAVKACEHRSVQALP